jgi:hypothetical protein
MCSVLIAFAAKVFRSTYLLHPTENLGNSAAHECGVQSLHISFVWHFAVPVHARASLFCDFLSYHLWTCVASVRTGHRVGLSMKGLTTHDGLVVHMHVLHINASLLYHQILWVGQQGYHASQNPLGFLHDRIFSFTHDARVAYGTK